MTPASRKTTSQLTAPYASSVPSTPVTTMATRPPSAATAMGRRSSAATATTAATMPMASGALVSKNGGNDSSNARR
jgi:hypothetical protein